MFSILVSALGCEKYLEICLNSIISSNVKCEIILINPKPSQIYNEIKQKFNKNINFVIEEPDEGAADGLNKALKYINNSYVCVLNGDDYFLENKLNIVVEAIKTQPDILIGNGYIVDRNDYLIKEFISMKFSPEKLIMSMCSICHQATFYKKKIFEEGIKFNKHNKISWDAEILLDAYLNNYNFKYIDDIISAFRIHSDSITGKSSNKKAHNFQLSLYFQRIKNRKINTLDKIWIFLIFNMFKITKINIKIKEIFRKKIKII